MASSPSSSLLEGLKILELGTLIAGPFAGRLFADFGAEVIKVESPKGGDPLRTWRAMHKETSLWWYAQARNKKSITLDLKSEEGQAIIKALADEVDIIIENFRPGKLEEWGIGYEDLKAINPRLIMIRISGYGQDGPYSQKPGFGSIGEGIGGLRYITGYPDQPPVRVGVSIGDSIAALYAVNSALMAIYYRDIAGSGEGQYIDIALYEAVFSLTESMLPEFDHQGIVRGRTGSSLPGIVPSNTYPCRNNTHIIIGGNGDSIFKRLMLAIGETEIAESPLYATNDGRAQHTEFIDETIANWTRQQTLEEALKRLDEFDVPCGPIYSIEEITHDPHYQAREMIATVEIEGLGPLKMPGIIPKFSKTPGKIKWPGPKLGEHNEEIYKEQLKLSEEALQALKDKKII